MNTQLKIPESIRFFHMHQHYFPYYRDIQSSYSTKAMQQDVSRFLAHARLLYFLACEATSHLDSFKLAEI